MDPQNKKPTEEQMQAWRDNYGKILVMESEVEVEGETLFVIARKPSRASFDRYQDEVMKKGGKAMLQFVKENILYPDKAVITALFDKYPGIANNLASSLQDAMGVSVTFTMTES